MKKQVITVLITLLVVAVVEVGVFFAFKDYFLGNKEETKTEEPDKNNASEEKDNNNEEKEPNKEEDDKLAGTFVVTYTDKTPKDWIGNQPSILTIEEEGTFIFNYNNCDDFYQLKGNYEIKDNVLTLLGTKGKHHWFEDEDVSFEIVSPTEVYLRLEDGISCTIGANAYQKGYGSFKKIY